MITSVSRHYKNKRSEFQLVLTHFLSSFEVKMERGIARLAVLSAHLEVSDQVLPPPIEPWCTSGASAPHGSLKGSLTIVDERTGKKYQVPVAEDGTVKSIDLKKVYIFKKLLLTSMQLIRYACCVYIIFRTGSEIYLIINILRIILM